MSDEPGLDCLYSRGVIVKDALGESSGHGAVRCQTVEDGSVEFLGFGDIGVDMQWVDVESQSVQECLPCESLANESEIWVGFWHLDCWLDQTLPCVTEASEPPQEKSGFVGKCQLPLTLLVPDIRVCPEQNKRVLALIHAVSYLNLSLILSADLDLALDDA